MTSVGLLETGVLDLSVVHAVLIFEDLCSEHVNACRLSPSLRYSKVPYFLTLHT